MSVKQINTMTIFFNVRSNPKHFLALNVFGFDLFVVPWKKLKAITITNIANYLNLVYLKTAINGKSTETGSNSESIPPRENCNQDERL